MHALFLELVIGIGLWFVGLHCISHQKCLQLGLLGHHAWKCAIDGPRTKNYVPLSHIHDKGLGWCIYGLNCIAMQSSVLCCCQTGSAGTSCRSTSQSADRQSIGGRWTHQQPMTTSHCRWQFYSADGVPQCPERHL